MTFTASLETTVGTFQHGFNLGTDERVARQCAADLMKLTWRQDKGDFVVKTVGLRNAKGKCIDYFDGQWSSEMNLEWEE